MLDLIIGFLPGAVEAMVKLGLLITGTALVAVLLVRRFRLRRAVFVRSFGKPARESDLDGKELADALRSRLEEIWKAHQGRALSSAGEATSLADPRIEGDDLGSKAIRLMAGNSPVGFLVGLSSKVWPALELEGEVVVGEDWGDVWGVRLKRGKEYFHAWQAKVNEGAVADAADELAHRIAVDTSRLGVLEEPGRGRERRSAGTRDWRAFKALTEAMKLWNHEEHTPSDPVKVAAVDAKLAEAIEHDPGYSLALCNRGTLHLTLFTDPATNDLARGYFEEALDVASQQIRNASQTKLDVDHRVKGLAYLGIARSCSQARHRFNRTDAATLERAREAADEATVYLNGSHESLYAKAFAWHCTETLEDIKVGREVYLQIVKEADREYPAVHNNLGFILMVGGEHLMKQGKEEEAERWWKDAEEHMKTTIELEANQMGRWEFAHANLGNLYRLKKRFSEAEKEYLKALAPEPEASTYTNGLNEYARLLLDWGRSEKNQERIARAERFHALALATTKDEQVQTKLKAEFRG